MNNVIELKGITFDLKKALPLTVGNWRELEKLGVPIGRKDGEVSVERLALLAQYVLKKANPEVADDFVNELTVAQLMEVAKAAPEAEESALDRPT